MKRSVFLPIILPVSFSLARNVLSHLEIGVKDSNDLLILHTSSVNFLFAHRTEVCLKTTRIPFQTYRSVRWSVRPVTINKILPIGLTRVDDQTSFLNILLTPSKAKI